ncbi:MAG TPA: TIGR03435 family protein [Bryobacteraceae bacterium]|nr:TIGR03435 family protein [Bryobacteraceae bacterium]
MLKVIFLICISLVCLRGADAVSFDVASIRPHAPDDIRFRVAMPSNGRFTATGAVAKLLLMLAYDVQETQLTGGPSWFATEKWDIEARSDDRIQHSAEETRRMLQSMLTERFALRIHRETEQRPVYGLTVAKGGPKFQAREQDGVTNVHITGNSIRMEAGELARMAQVLATALGRPVIDRTALSGRYDLSLQWDDAPIREGGVPGLDVPAAPGNDHGSIFSAIQDQLGLRLEAQQAPVEVIIVDRMERPSPN